MRKLLSFLPLFMLLVWWSASQQGLAHPPVDEVPPASARPGFQSADREAAPLSLTTQDGTGLLLVDYHARAVVEGPLAFTELHLTFKNPEDRVLEGRFEITLPERAAISRFAMEIGGKWQEAEMVERQAARRAYEDFLHRAQDPALLEKEAGNEFRARIFPIPARGEKRLILSYSQELERSDEPYRLPLQGLPEVAKLDLDVRVGQSSGDTLRPESVRIQRENFQPQGDFVVPQPRGVHGLSSGKLVVARIAPQLSARDQAPRELLVLLDTSASRALGFKDHLAKVRDLLGQLPELERITVAAFDQEVVSLYEGSPQGFPVERLMARRALGATDLARALQWAGQQKGHSRMLLITDGISTAGSEELISTLKNSSLQRLDVVAVGGIRDREKMKVLVGGTLSDEGAVLDGDLPSKELARRLGLSVTSGLDLQVEGADWVWPTTLDSLQPGDEQLVYARVQNPSEMLTIKLPQQTISTPLTKLDSSPLVERQAIVARIALLESQLGELKDGEEKAAVEQEIVSLSTDHRVLSDKTALLVLETEEDYTRFGIDRKALADILEVGPEGLRLRQRDEVVVAIVDQQPKTPTDMDDGKGKDDKELAEKKAAEISAEANEDGELRLEQPAPYVASSGSAGGSSPSNEPSARPAPRRARLETRPAAQEVTPGVTSDSEATEESEAPEADEDSAASSTPPLNGTLAEITRLLQAGDRKQALEKAQQWQKDEPGNVLALIALGECFEALGRIQDAARVYGSIIDLFPSRADLRRYAGGRLQALGEHGLNLAIDSFQKATEQRGDHVSSHRFLAMALARQGRYEDSFKALEAGLGRDYPSGRFAGYERILQEDLSIVGAAWASRSPKLRPAIEKRLKDAGAGLASKPSLRFVLTWETDANDVDFHIRDSKQGHAYYSSQALPSGGELFADVTTGYGPECFAIPDSPQAFPYSLQIHYYSRGPMGYGMGQLEILQHDGKGGLKFEERPYVVMTDGAYVDLGVVEQSL